MYSLRDARSESEYIHLTSHSNLFVRSAVYVENAMKLTNTLYKL
jgi:hypothetical protein